MKDRINPNCKTGKPLIEPQTWTGILEPALCEDAAAVESLAHLLFAIREAINSGPEGIERASEALATGIELTYLYSDAHRAALKLYLLSLTGQLKPQDEPLRLIKGAIEKGLATLEFGRKSAASKRKRS
ncbi:MAG TPA: hypothetical protein VNA19_14040 [Pyrinomonadaceae bacterium]|nr:hypothetical protein [Pyrinomonadaceae bacterium]